MSLLKELKELRKNTDETFLGLILFLFLLVFMLVVFLFIAAVTYDDNKWELNKDEMTGEILQEFPDNLPDPIVIGEYKPFIIQESQGDGHCFYHSLVTYLDGINVKELRKKLANHMRNPSNSEYYKNTFYEPEAEFLKVENWEDYLNEMENGRLWGDSASIYAAQEVFNVCIAVYRTYTRTKSPSLANGAIDCWDLNEGRIMLIHTGSHFDAIILRNTHKKIDISEEAIARRNAVYDMYQFRKNLMIFN